MILIYQLSYLVHLWKFNLQVRGAALYPWMCAAKLAAVVGIHCQLDRIRNQLGDKPSGTPVRNYLEEINLYPPISVQDMRDYLD